MEDVEYNVFLATGVAGKLQVILTDAGVETVEGAVNIGGICHPRTEDPLGFSENHVLYHHIREMLYHLNSKGEPSFWPDNVTDMEGLTIEYQPAVEVEEE